MLDQWLTPVEPKPIGHAISHLEKGFVKGATPLCTACMLPSFGCSGTVGGMLSGLGLASAATGGSNDGQPTSTAYADAASRTRRSYTTKRDTARENQRSAGYKQ